MAAHAQQFEDLEQQHDSARLGMWVFLATEVLFFGGLFTGYATYRWLYPAAFAGASRLLDLRLGTLNTAVLLVSSLTMALAVHAAEARRRRALVFFLAATMLLGTIFLVIKATEYAHKFSEHLVPGPGFAYPGPQAPGAQLFFSFYFVMTGMHAVHMAIGIALLGVLALGALGRRHADPDPARIAVAGLYWHFVDVIWIFLYPLLYLVGARR